MVTNLNKKMLTGFSREVRSYLPSIREDIEGYRHNAGESNSLEEALRHLHTIKGASALMGLSALTRLTAYVQELLENVLAGQTSLDSDQDTWLCHTIDRIEPYLDALLDGDTDDQGLIEEIEQSYSALRMGSAAEGVETDVADQAPDAASMPSEDSPNSADTAEVEAIRNEAQPVQTEDIVFAWSRDASESQDADATESIADMLPSDDEEEMPAARDDDASADEIEQTEAVIISGSSGNVDDRLEDGAATPDREPETAATLDAYADSDDHQPSGAPEEEWVSEVSEHLGGESEYPDSVVSEADVQVEDESDVNGDTRSSSESSGGAHIEEVELTETALVEPASGFEEHDSAAEKPPYAIESEISPIDATMHGDDSYAPLPDAEDNELAFGSDEVDGARADVGWADTSESQEIETLPPPEPVGTWDEPSSQDHISSGERILSGYDLTGAVEKPPATPGALDELIESIDHEVRQAYHHEAVSTPRRPSLAYMGTEERYVTFVIAGTLYAVSVTSVLEISRVPHITPIPNVPPWILGVINLRGEIISVMDLRAFLGINEAYQADSSRMLVVRTQGDEVTTSLLVDQVRGFVRLDIKQMAAAGTSLDDWVAPYLTGVFEYEDQILAVMDLEGFLLSPEICQFD